jgi:hypothetical protein
MQPRASGVSNFILLFFVGASNNGNGISILHLLLNKLFLILFYESVQAGWYNIKCNWLEKKLVLCLLDPDMFNHIPLIRFPVVVS